MNAMINIEKYKWYIYQGRDVELITDHPELDLGLSAGEKFGYRKIGANHYIVDRSNLNVRFKVKEKDAVRLIMNSNGWGGKIKGVPVVKGEGGKDKPVQKDKNIYTLDIDSSNLKRAWLDVKKKELHVVFHSDVHWLYEDVSLKLAKQLEAAESQGRFFIYRIRDVKPQYKISD